MMQRGPSRRLASDALRHLDRIMHALWCVRYDSMHSSA